MQGFALTFFYFAVSFLGFHQMLEYRFRLLSFSQQRNSILVVLINMALYAINVFILYIFAFN